MFMGDGRPRWGALERSALDGKEHVEAGDGPNFVAAGAPVGEGFHQNANAMHLKLAESVETTDFRDVDPVLAPVVEGATGIGHPSRHFDGGEGRVIFFPMRADEAAGGVGPDFDRDRIRLFFLKRGVDFRGCVVHVFLACQGVD